MRETSLGSCIVSTINSEPRAYQLKGRGNGSVRAFKARRSRGLQHASLEPAPCCHTGYPTYRHESLGWLRRRHSTANHITAPPSGRAGQVASRPRWRQSRQCAGSTARGAEPASPSPGRDHALKQHGSCDDMAAARSTAPSAVSTNLNALRPLKAALLRPQIRPNERSQLRAAHEGLIATIDVN